MQRRRHEVWFDSAPVALLALAACGVGPDATQPHRTVASTTAIHWRDFTPTLFADARDEKRLVLLDLGTGWCHWCHVMEETTYCDATVVDLVDRHYLAAKVDADAHPDLANRYEDYGWPATIVFDANGVELAKLRGYLPPARVASLLQAFVDDPTPGPSARGEVAPADASTGSSPGPSSTDSLAPQLHDELLAAHVAAYDQELGGFGHIQKYLPEWSVEYDLELARHGDADAGRRSRATLSANLKLIDPVWGGVDQYSDSGDWDHPHFEKIMSFQGLDLRLYSLAFSLWNDERDRAAAQQVHRYLVTFLRSPDGDFFTSQDADLVPGEHSADYYKLDDVGRRARGVPRIDRHVYARENGFAIRGLVALHAATGERDALDEAVVAARRIMATHRAADGGFKHDASDAGAYYLGDTLAMLQAFLDLHQATGDATWLAAAVAAADDVDRLFGAGAGATGTNDANAIGIPNSLPVADATGRLPAPQRDENAALARAANRLFHETDAPRFRALAERALRYVLSPSVARLWPTAATLLVADELASDPVHVTVVAARADPAGRALFAAALRLPTGYKVVERYDPAVDPPPRGGITFPDSLLAAAFLCANGSCSAPITVPAELASRVVRRP